MTAGDQRDRDLIVHGHEERLADVLGRSNWVRIAVRAFRINVDEAHLHRAERLGKLALAAVTFVAEPSALRTPVKLFGLPNIGAAAGETEVLKPIDSSATLPAKDHGSAQEIFGRISV